jgi:hypothetical protein
MPHLLYPFTYIHRLFRVGLHENEKKIRFFEICAYYITQAADGFHHDSYQFLSAKAALPVGRAAQIDQAAAAGHLPASAKSSAKTVLSPRRR